MKCHNRSIAGKFRFCDLRSIFCAFAVFFLFLSVSRGSAATPAEAGPKFEGSLRGILAVYDAQGEAAALRRAKLSGVRIRQNAGEGISRSSSRRARVFRLQA